MNQNVMAADLKHKLGCWAVGWAAELEVRGAEYSLEASVRQ